MSMRKYGTAPDQVVLPEEGDPAQRTEDPAAESSVPVTYGLPHPRRVLDEPLPGDVSGR